MGPAEAAAEVVEAPPDAIPNSFTPAWVRVLASATESGYEPPVRKDGRPTPWLRSKVRHLRCYIDGSPPRQWEFSRTVQAVRAMVEQPGLAHAWYHSSNRFHYPCLSGHEEVNPLRLASDEIANLAVPRELLNDTDVIAAQALCQGFYGKWAGAFPLAITKQAFLAGVAKLNDHPLVMVMVAEPFFTQKTLLHMSDAGVVANLRDVEGSLLRGTHMTDREAAIWLSSPLLEPALLRALEWRRKSRHPRVPVGRGQRTHRFTHKGWWHPQGCPLPPPVGLWKNRDRFDISCLP